MRFIGRLLVAALSLLVLVVALYGGMKTVEWLSSRDAFGLLSRQPMEPVRIRSLDPYTRRVAGRRWFSNYFTTMVFTRTTSGPAPILSKWERDTVVIRQLNTDGAEVTDYLAGLVQRLDRLQHQVDFTLGGPNPRITIEYLGHDAYVRQNGNGSVGNTRTRYFQGPPGLIRARISVDVGVQDTPDEVKSTVIHELTHAIGAGGHFYSPTDRRRSVMYEANTLTMWSQNDAAVIRVLYSPFERPGMSEAAARAGLQRFARAAR